ncbi:hypothetical protein ABPG75_002501 [Micractinium tetrahymenae]
MYTPEGLAAVERAARTARQLLEQLPRAVRSFADVWAAYESMGDIYSAAAAVYDSMTKLGDSTEPLPPSTQRALADLVPLLAHVAAEAAADRASWPAGGPGLLARPDLLMHHLSALSSVCSLMRTLLVALRSGQLRLGEADVMRLCTAAGVPLHVHPQLLARHLGGAPPDVLAPMRKLLEQGLACTAELLGALVEVRDEPSWLPPRVAATLRATSARPDRLLTWLRQAVSLGAIIAESGGSLDPLKTQLFDAISCALLVDGLAELLSEKAALQAALVRLAGPVLWEHVAAHGPASREACYMVQLLAAHEVRHGRCLHEQQSGGALLRGTVALLQRLPALLKGDSGGGNEGGGSSSGGRVDAHWLSGATSSAVHLLGVLIVDAGRQEADQARGAGQQQHLSPALGRLLTTDGLLPGLHAVLDLLAAGPPAAGQGGGPGALRMLWADPLETPDALACLAKAIAYLRMHCADAVELPAGTPLPAVTEAAEALLGIAAAAPGLPVWPAGAHSLALGVPARSVPPPADVGTAEALLGNPPAVLAAHTAGLGTHLLRLALNSVTCGSAEAVGEAAPAAFRAAMTTCRCVWAAAAVRLLPPDLWDSEPRAAARVACQLACKSIAQAADAAGCEPAASAALGRKLECLAICYSEAAAVRPGAPQEGSTHDSVGIGGGPLSMHLRTLASLAEHRQAGEQLLVGAEARAALLRDAGAQLDDALDAADCLPPGKQMDLEGVTGAIIALRRACALLPSLLPSLLSRPSLLDALCCIASRVPAAQWRDSYDSIEDLSMCQLAAASTAFLLMRALLLALNRGMLQLGEADAMRLCTAASTPLHSQPRALPEWMAPMAAGAIPTAVTVAAQALELGFTCICELSQALNAAEEGGEVARWLPPRVAEALRASTARPDRLLAWAQRAVGEVAARVDTHGPRVLMETGIFDALASVCEQPGVLPLLGEQPAEQQAALVRLLASGLQAAHAAAPSDRLAARKLLNTAGLLSTRSLRQGRLLHAQQTGDALLQSMVQLLQQLPAILKGNSSSSDAASKSSRSTRSTRSTGSVGADGLLPSHRVLVVQAAVRLLAVMIEDACEQTQGSQGDPAQPLSGTAQPQPGAAPEGEDGGSEQLVQLSPAIGQLLTSGALEALFGFLELVAAAGPNQPASPGGASPALQCCWSGPTLVQALSSLGLAFSRLGASVHSASELSAGMSCAQAAAAAELLLRLGGLLPAMPALPPAQPGAPPVAAVAVPAAPEAETLEVLQCNPAQLLAVLAASLAGNLYRMAFNRFLDLAAASTAEAEEELEAAALPAFWAAMSACRWAWAEASGQLLPANSCGHGQPNVLHEACLLAYSIHDALLERSADENPDLAWRVHCIAVCHAEALPARPPAALGAPGDSPFDSSYTLMLGLERLFAEPEAAEHWLASSMGASAMLAGAAELLSGTLKAMSGGQQDEAEESQDRLVRALAALQLACAGFPEVMPPLVARHRPLLRALRDVAAWLAGAHDASEHLDDRLSRLLRGAVEHLQAQGSTSTGGGDNSGSGSNSAAVHIPMPEGLLRCDPSSLSPAEMAQLLLSFADSLPLESGNGSSNGGADQAANQAAAALPLTAELALRRARALSARPGCGNPRCADLTGPSEAGRRGKLCTGCMLVRYCCTACSKADWKAHRPACRLLVAQRATAEQAGGSSNMAG